MTELRRTETRHKQDPRKSTLTQLNAIRDQVKQLTQAGTEKALKWLKQKYYEKRNKADFMLAHCLKHGVESKWIDKMRTQLGQRSKVPERIGERVQKYFTALYNHTPSLTPDDVSYRAGINTFLDKLNLPTLPQITKTAIAAVVTTEEMAVALKIFKPNKSPGPDG
ncbi:Hypothetical predicted protein, partial [Pelobates cultripes]